MINGWYGFRMKKGQTDTIVEEIGSDTTTISDKPCSSTSNIYPATFNKDGTINYKLGGGRSNNSDLTRNAADDADSNLDGTDGNVGIRVEPFYYRRDVWSNGVDLFEEWKFSKYPLAGYNYVPRLMIGIYPAYYDNGLDELRSISGVTPETNQTRSWFRSKAANVGSGWCIMPYHYYNILYHLLVAERLNLNTQEDISVGATNASSSNWDTYNNYYPVWTSDGGAASSYSGSGDVSATPTEPNSADVRTGEFSIEVANWGDGTLTLNTQVAVIWHTRDLFGHTWEFQDGLNIHNSSDLGARAFTARNSDYFADDIDQNYNLVGNIAEGDGYVSQFLSRHMLPVSVAGGSAAHCGDYHYSYYDNDPDSGWRVARVGGALSFGSKAGLSFFNVTNDSSVVYSNVGARLCKIG